MWRYVALVLFVGCQEYKISTPPTPDSDEPTTVVPPGTPTPPSPAPNPEAPEISCDVSSAIVQPPFDAVQLTADVVDDRGIPVTEWYWSILNAPSGTNADPAPNNAQNTSVNPDLVGVYEYQVIATNSAGVDSAPCTIQLEAVAAEDFRVEMFWDQVGDDMDLHLIAPGGSFQSSTDCYYSNCQPNDPFKVDWGTLGYEGDDPTLDLDDVDLTGPENINIDDPINGVYQVVVHDFGTDPGIASTNVTVNIYLDGNLVWTDTRNIPGDLSENYFAEIDWNTRSVTSL